MSKTTAPSSSARDLHAPESQAVAAGSKIDVGGRLRALRERRRLSIRALAEASGLAVNTLSLIENGKTSPSVSTLQQIAVALGVPITAFFEPDEPHSRLIFLKVNQQHATHFPHGSISDLGAGMAQRSIEPLLLMLNGNSESGSQPMLHPGQEFVLCLEGRILYTIESQSYLLEPGDSLIFESSIPHRWENPDATPSRALLVLCPYEPTGSSTVRHGLTLP